MPWQWMLIILGSVSLMVQSYWLYQLDFWQELDSSIYPDPTVIPNLARYCKGNIQIDFYAQLEH